MTGSGPCIRICQFNMGCFATPKGSGESGIPAALSFEGCRVASLVEKGVAFGFAVRHRGSANLPIHRNEEVFVVTFAAPSGDPASKAERFTLYSAGTRGPNDGKNQASKRKSSRGQSGWRAK
jgi:hypothetical protein